MNDRRVLQIVGMIVAVGAMACAPSAPPAAQRGESSVPRADLTPQPTVVLVSRGDPATLATKGFATNTGSFGLTAIFNATLSFKDEREAPNPFLAQALPQLNSDSWTVSPDGRMTTTWK